MEAKNLFSTDELVQLAREHSRLLGNQDSLSADSIGMVSVSQKGVNVPLYIGWIPCLAGHLFFNLSEPGLVYQDCFNVNFLDADPTTGAPKCRYIVASSVYDFKDSGKKHDLGLARVIVAAKAETPYRVSGEIYFIPFLERQHTHDETQNHERVLKELHNLSEHHHLITTTRYDSPALEERLSHFSSRLSGFCASSGDGAVVSQLLRMQGWKVLSVHFEIDDAGFIYLAFAGSKSEYEALFSVHEDVVNNAPLSINTLCRQAFYYLKYLLHKHSHHAHYNDSLTTIHRVRAERWRMADAMIRDIKRGLVEDKRAKRFDSHNNAGIAAYGKSLVTSCERKRLVPQSANPDSPYNAGLQATYFSNLSDSIAILRDTHKTGPSRFRSIMGTFQQALVLPFLFLTPFLLVLNWRVSQHDDVCKNPGTFDLAAPTFLDFGFKIFCGPNGIGILLLTYVLFVLGAMGLSRWANREVFGESFLRTFAQWMHCRTYSLHRTKTLRDRFRCYLNQAVIEATMFQDRVGYTRDRKAAGYAILITVAALGPVVFLFMYFGYKLLMGG